MRSSFWLLLVGGLLVAANPQAANPQPPEHNSARKAPAKDEQSIKVEVTGLVKTGIAAIGGETTGITITANKVTWELDIKDPALLALAKEMDGKTAIAKGELRAVEGVEIPRRWIVTVSDIKAK